MTTALVPLDQLDALSQKLAVSGLFAGKPKEQIFALLMLAHGPRSWSASIPTN